MVREVIFAEDLEDIFGKRPWASRHDELILQNGNGEEDTALLTGETKEREVTVAENTDSAEVESIAGQSTSSDAEDQDVTTKEKDS